MSVRREQEEEVAAAIAEHTVAGKPIQVIGKPYRLTLKAWNGNALSKELLLRVRLSDEQAVATNEDYGSLRLLSGQYRTIEPSPLCDGCKSRGHILGACPWLEIEGLRMKNYAGWLKRENPNAGPSFSDFHDFVQP